MGVGKAVSRDQYDERNLRSENPIKFGEYLLSLQDQGMNQQEIAAKFSLHRLSVGRYQKIARWDDQVKAYIQENRDKISNTHIIGLASRLLSKDELLLELKKIAGDDSPIAVAEVKSFPNLSGFNDLMAQITRLEERIEQLESEKKTVVQQIPLPKEPSLTWSMLFSRCVRPAQFMMMICITLLTGYLVHQAVIFFAAIDPNYLSASASAVISEMIPLCAAGCLALSRRWGDKLIALSVILVTIVGSTFFMHSSLSNQVARQTGPFERLSSQRVLLLASIARQTADIGTLPKDRVTRRQEIEQAIKKDRSTLAGIDDQLARTEVGAGDLENVTFSYSVWIRVAAMILNAYLVHLFFRAFRRKEYAN